MNMVMCHLYFITRMEELLPLVYPQLLAHLGISLTEDNRVGWSHSFFQRCPANHDWVMQECKGLLLAPPWHDFESQLQKPHRPFQVFLESLIVASSLAWLCPALFSSAGVNPRTTPQIRISVSELPRESSLWHKTQHGVSTGGSGPTGRLVQV